MKTSSHDYLKGSVLHYVRQEGVDLASRTGSYFEWVNLRKRKQVWVYERTAQDRAATQFTLCGNLDRAILNFSSQDYLGLAQDARMIEAAAQGAKDFGVHSAGSPAFCGSTRALRKLEERIAEAVGYDEVVVYPTGWAAGYGVPVALIRADD